MQVQTQRGTMMGRVTRTGQARAIAARPSDAIGNADVLWAEHGWALGYRAVALIILAILAPSALDTLLRWLGVPGLFP